MLASQRALFDIPREVCYLNAASWSPLPLATHARPAAAAVGRKGRPWLIDSGFAAKQYERTRKAAARLINADPEDVALISSVGYGVATAAKIVPVPRGCARAGAAGRSFLAGAGMDDAGGRGRLHRRDGAAAPATATGPRPCSPRSSGRARRRSRWCRSRRCTGPTAARSISARVAPAVRAHGAALLVDATHSAGVTELDVRALDPDFVVFPTYKWLLGPYGRAFLYVARRHQGGIPLEQTSYGRRAVRAEQDVYLQRHRLRRRRAALRHGRARSFHLDGDGGDRHGDDGANGARPRSSSGSPC